MPITSIIFCQCCQYTFKPAKGPNGRTLCTVCRKLFEGKSGRALRQAIIQWRTGQTTDSHHRR